MNNIFYITLFVIASALINSYSAQDTLSLENALKIAQANNPGVKAATLHVEREKAMLKSNVSVDKTQFSYSLGQMNSSLIDYSINVNQSFKFPAFGARKNLLQAKVNAGESNLAIAQSELNRSVRTEFAAINNLSRQLMLYKEQEENYAAMQTIATKKLAVGESTILEKTIAESKFQEMQIARQKIEMEITARTNNLSLLLYSKVQLVAIDATINLELPLVDSSKMNGNPLLGYYQQSIDIKQKEVVLNKKEYLPDFNVGYFNQQIDGVQGHQGVQVGISIPLFVRQQKAVVNASKIDVDVSTYEMENYKLNLNQLFQDRMQHYNKYALEIDYFTTKGEKLSMQLSEFAEKAYTKGEIGYLEYIENLNQAKQIRLNYLESLQEYHSEIIELLYLTGQ